ncbi:glucokinase regulatory [Mycoplasmopsis canis UFG4]|uniref:Glucokinase regulatory n=1 Tax=Mycoplasmopsis canis UFG4 TaxID=1131455 RepID=I1A5E3_9BACT|nr:N-acetylmuramic acid 6-phosphate etherase [Mycoplasmopsis canis]EIE40147.1 glucokinase regulatory [Mycoplasmopsis canis UF33]EIE41501.1 glucokinase regulatory [Mycoplasmopsis canis UFG1]EIE41714.1 glucokinase regulatory [Mycoplasmopsis canis UFG4]
MDNLDKLEIKDLVDIFSESTADVYLAITKAKKSLEKATKIISNSIKNGGKIIYVGAGSSGRIGLVDALDVIPTFNERNWFLYSMAGGEPAVLDSLEGFEDDYELGVADAKKNKISEKDIVVGLSASGNTKYVAGFFDYSRKMGAKNILIENKQGGRCENLSDLIIFIDTGQEIIEGSTRLKSATAQKIILNMFSSIAAIKNNKVFNNLMIDVTPINEKLVQRSIDIISTIMGCSLHKAQQAYEESQRNIKLACIMIKYNLDIKKAKILLDKHKNNLREALENGNDN